MEVNTLYCGDSLVLIDELDLRPDLIIMHPPDIGNFNYTKEQYVGFLKTIYNKCWDKLATNGTLVSVNTDRKQKGIFAKHFEIMKIMEERHLINYKILAKSLKTNLFVPTFSHVLFYAKGKAVNNKVADFSPDVWLLKGEKIKGYPAKDNFPSLLAERIILNCSKENSLVLDPFVGSGTVAVSAKKLGRNYLGFDISNEFIELSKQRLGA